MIKSLTLAVIPMNDKLQLFHKDVYFQRKKVIIRHMLYFYKESTLITTTNV